MENERHACLWHEDVPAWYELSLSGPNLLISVDKRAIKSFDNPLTGNSILVENIRGSYDQKLPEFADLSCNKPWGFGSVLKPARQITEGWFCWKYSIPVEKNSLGPIDSALLAPFTATLQTLIIKLSLVKPTPGNNRLQLIAIDSIWANGGGPRYNVLTATITPAMSRWIASHPLENWAPQVQSAMRSAFNRLWRKNPFRRDDFGVLQMRPGQIILGCPGNACDLAPSDFTTSGAPDLSGYELTPHNLDGPVQSLALLFGLAALNKTARELP